ncbi:fructosamine kinase family protein [Parapedobacter luteus]|uniref:fructosamine kinase family protein n=1 Tax=Parapedobacter luteus TaxID=623280 RepID=UPI0009A62C68|nr:fructosamine kinase family protein [Parapedobacter luteus]
MIGILHVTSKVGKITQRINSGKSHRGFVSWLVFLSESLFQALEAAIKATAPGDFRIQRVVPVSGGDINRAYQLQTKSGRYFAKVNDAPQAPQMFVAESTGLAMLRQTVGIRAPQPFMAGQAHRDAFLLMEWIDAAGKHSEAGQAALGRMLAALHSQHRETFGLDHDNFIGRLPQANTPSADWTAFFIGQRLQKQLDIAQHTYSQAGLRASFDRLFARLGSLYPQEPPSLLHGDLWGGNYLVDAAGQPALIDPAVYYGHREADIAMTKLFGGFSTHFYAAYHEAYPLQAGWEARMDLWNLYPLLVHLNLFGASYLGAIQRSLKRYV